MKLEAGSEPSCWPGPCFEVKEGGFLLGLVPAPPREPHTAPPGPGVMAANCLQGPGGTLGIQASRPMRGQERVCFSWHRPHLEARTASLISEAGDGRGQRARGIQCVAHRNVVLIFVSNFRMNNSVAMPRLEYFSVFSKM